MKHEAIKNLKSLLIGILTYVIPIFGVIRIAADKKDSVGAKIAKSIFYIILWVFAFSLAYLVIWTLLSSMKTDSQFQADMLAMPEKWSFANYKEAYMLLQYNGVGFVGMFINNIWFAGGAALLSTLSHAVTGYIFAKYKFPGKEVAFKFILFTIALPIVGSLPSMYKVVYSMGIEESPLFLITFLGGFGSNFLIMYAVFTGIDRTYMEAAEIDGATRFGMFFKIMLPLAVGPCFSIFLLTFIMQWNNYESPILFLDTMPTLASGLYQFSEMMYFPEAYPGKNPEMVFFASILLASLPVVILVACFGDKLMTNVSVGGIKG